MCAGACAGACAGDCAVVLLCSMISMLCVVTVIQFPAWHCYFVFAVMVLYPSTSVIALILSFLFVQSTVVLTRCLLASMCLTAAVAAVIIMFFPFSPVFRGGFLSRLRHHGRHRGANGCQ